MSHGAPGLEIAGNNSEHTATGRNMKSAAELTSCFGSGSVDPRRDSTPKKSKRSSIGMKRSSRQRAPFASAAIWSTVSTVAASRRPRPIRRRRRCGPFFRVSLWKRALLGCGANGALRFWAFQLRPASSRGVHRAGGDVIRAEPAAQQIRARGGRPLGNIYNASYS